MGQFLGSTECRAKELSLIYLIGHQGRVWSRAWEKADGTILLKLGELLEGRSFVLFTFRPPVPAMAPGLLGGVQKILVYISTND